MTKKKVKWAIKRLLYINRLIKEGKTEGYCDINKRKEWIVIDEDVKVIAETVDEIIKREPNKWVRDILMRLKRGDKDITIIINSPLERSKYYLMKERLISKIYNCCIYRRLVGYDEIMNEGII